MLYLGTEQFHFVNTVRLSCHIDIVDLFQKVFYDVINDVKSPQNFILILNLSQHA